MNTETKGEVWPAPGRAFEDILDGYFPLGESVRQMMARNGFSSVWINLLHAPVMNLHGLPPTAPVPLHLPKTYSGMIDFMALTATLSDGETRLTGVGNWFWVDGREENNIFPTVTRLGEPAFIRGIGLTADVEGSVTSPTIAIARPPSDVPLEESLEQATAQLGWQASRAWGLGQAVSDIRHATGFDLPRALHGKRLDARHQPGEGLPPVQHSWSCDRDYLLVNISPDQEDAEALELALRL